MLSSKVRAVLLFFLILAFGGLIFGGYVINRSKPPIPVKVVSPAGDSMMTREDIINGQNYYFSRGGQHIGTIWGHGSYLAPDWSADYLHRMGLYIAARHHGLSLEDSRGFTQSDFKALDSQEQARLSVMVKDEIKTNRFSPETGVLELTQFQTEAVEALTDYYTHLLKTGDERMGLQAGIVRSNEEGRLVSAFFSWLAWAAGTLRPDADYTYTTNWPYDPLVGNQPLPDFLIWSIVSVIILILGIAAALFVYLRYIGRDEYKTDLLVDFPEPNPTPSQKATLLYFLTAVGLFVIQIGAGAVTAHYTVEGTHFFGISLAKILPYALVRTWHLQLAVFFIATCFLAAGLFIGPFVGKEPKGRDYGWSSFSAPLLWLSSAP
jgi:nitric oxide reductase subunit B